MDEIKITADILSDAEKTGDRLAMLKEYHSAAAAFAKRALELQTNDNFVQVVSQLPPGNPEKKIIIENNGHGHAIRIYRQNYKPDSPLVFEETPLDPPGKDDADAILQTNYLVAPENATDFKIVRYLKGDADGRTDFNSGSLTVLPDAGKVRSNIQAFGLAEIHLGYLQTFVNLASKQSSSQT